MRKIVSMSRSTDILLRQYPYISKRGINMQTSTLKEKAYELGIDMVGIVAAEDIDRYAGLPVTW